MSVRLRFLGFLAVAFLLPTAAFASSPWDWLGELSGPGPFQAPQAVVSNQLVTFCRDRGETSIGTSQAVNFQTGEVNPKVKCFYADFRRLESDKTSRFNPVKVQAFEFGASFQVARFLELGFGAGVIRFDTTDNAGNSFTPARLTFTPARGVLKPAALLFLIPSLQRDPSKEKWYKAASILKLYVKETFILGHVSGSDFGVSDAVFPQVTNDFVPSRGAFIDLGELISLFR